MIRTVVEFTWYEDSEDLDSNTPDQVKEKIEEHPINASIDAYLERRDGEMFEVRLVEVEEA